MNLESTIEELISLGCNPISFGTAQGKPLVCGNQTVQGHDSASAIEHRCVASTFAGATMMLINRAKHCDELKSNVLAVVKGN